MRRKRTITLAGASLAALAVAGSTAGAGSAAITPEPDLEPAAERLARSIIDDNSRLLGRADFALIPPGGVPAATSTTRLAGFPTAGSSYMILSNGDATAADNRNNAPDFGIANGGPFIRGARDGTILKIKVRRPAGANCLSFTFRFLSDEFPEFKDTQFNDAFIAELDKSTWNTRSNDDPTIEAPRNFAVGANGQRVSVNATDEASVSSSRSRGTTYDAGTRLLRASIPVRRSKHVLYLSIFDQGDRQYDSAVFIDDLRVIRSSSCRSGIEDIGR